MKQIIKCWAACWLLLLAVCVVQAQPNITRVEYYFDNDPGYNNATAFSITPNTNLSNLALNINPASLPYGVHVLGIRAQDANGAWSQDNLWVFARPYPSDSTKPGPIPNLKRVEYYLDNDRGYGSGTAISFSSTNNLSNIALNLNNDSITQGVHILGIRAQDSNGAWSLDNLWLFAKPYTPDTTSPGPVPKLKQVEYYFDKDPGYGNGVPVAINPLTNLPNFNMPINIMGLTAGNHKLFIRSKDANGAWSLDNKFAFTVNTAITGTSIIVNSVTKKTLCAKDSFAVSYHVNTTYNTGNVFSVQLSDSSGSFASPTVVGSYTGTGNAIVQCTLPAHISNGSLYRVRVVSTNAVVTGVTGSDSLTIRDAPSVPTIIGTSVANATFTYQYSVPLIASSTWAWAAPAATVTATLDSANLLWNMAGTQSVKVVQTNQYGCASDTAAEIVNVYPLRIDTVTVSNTAPCPGSGFVVNAKASGVYNAGNIFTAQLSDSTGSFASPVNIGADTLSPIGNAEPVSINATMPSPTSNGTLYKVRVVSSNPVVTAIDNTQNISVNNLGISGAIKGQSSNLCGGETNVKYTSDSVANASSYVWTIPSNCTLVSGQGTLSIKVNVPANFNSGFITVSAQNSCGSSAQDSLKILAKPGAPSKLVGPKKVTANEANLIYSTAVTSGESYTWSIPTGAEINSGQGSDSINVTWGSVAGDVSVTAINNCGSSTTKSLKVTLAKKGMEEFDTESDDEKDVNRHASTPLNLYPNPAGNSAMLDFQILKESKYSIKVTDLTGKVLLLKEGFATIGENKILLDVSKFSKGMYFVCVIDEDNGLQTIKLEKE